MKALLLIGLLSLVGCGSDGNSENAPSPKPLCEGSKLVREGYWPIDSEGQIYQIHTDEHCSYKEIGPDGSVYEGDFIDHNLGSQVGTVTVTLNDQRSLTLGYSISSDLNGEERLILYTY